jgi:hypothetical protein
MVLANSSKYLSSLSVLGTAFKDAAAAATVPLSRPRAAVPAVWIDNDKEAMKSKLKGCIIRTGPAGQKEFWLTGGADAVGYTAGGAAKIRYSDDGLATSDMTIKPADVVAGETDVILGVLTTATGGGAHAGAVRAGDTAITLHPVAGDPGALGVRVGIGEVQERTIEQVVAIANLEWIPWVGKPATPTALLVGGDLPARDEVLSSAYTPADWTGPGARLRAATLAEMGAVGANLAGTAVDISEFIAAWTGGDTCDAAAAAMALILAGTPAAEAGASPAFVLIKAAGVALNAALQQTLGALGEDAAAAVGKRTASLRGLGLAMGGHEIGTYAAEAGAGLEAGAETQVSRAAPLGLSPPPVGGVGATGGGGGGGAPTPDGAGAVAAAGTRMNALRPKGHEADTCAQVVGALADAQGEAAQELIQLLGGLSGDAKPLPFFGGTGGAICDRAGEDFDRLADKHGPTFEGRPRDWGEAVERLLAVVTRASRAGGKPAGVGTEEESGGGNGQPRIAHTPARGATTRATKATGAGQRAVASSVAAPLATEEAIEAEHFAQRGATPLLEAARLVASPSYGEAAAAVLSSDGTFYGSLGEKGAMAATSNQRGSRARGVGAKHTHGRPAPGSTRTL